MLDPAGIFRVCGDVTGVKELLFSVQDGEFVFGKTEVLAEVSLEELIVDATAASSSSWAGPSERQLASPGGGCRVSQRPRVRR